MGHAGGFQSQKGPGRKEEGPNAPQGRTERAERTARTAEPEPGKADTTSRMHPRWPDLLNYLPKVVREPESVMNKCRVMLRVSRDSTAMTASTEQARREGEVQTSKQHGSVKSVFCVCVCALCVLTRLHCLRALRAS